MPSINDILFGKPKPQAPPTPAKDTPTAPLARERRLVAPTAPATVASDELRPIKLSLPPSATVNPPVPVDPVDPVAFLPPLAYVKEWLNECTDPAPPGNRGMSTSALHAHYQIYMGKRNAPPKHETPFGQMLSFIMGEPEHREDGNYRKLVLKPTPLQLERQQVKAQEQVKAQDKSKRNLRRLLR